MPAEVADAKRWRWSAFGFADLCSFRLTKLMLDAGLPWSTASSVASDETLWRSHDSEAGDVRYLAVFPKSNQYTLYSPETLAADLANGTVKHVYIRFGRNMLPPEEEAERQRAIGALAARLVELADKAGEGTGSYRQFEEILAGLHSQGKFPDNAAVSAVAFAFAD